MAIRWTDQQFTPNDSANRGLAESNNQFANAVAKFSTNNRSRMNETIDDNTRNAVARMMQIKSLDDYSAMGDQMNVDTINSNNNGLIRADEVMSAYDTRDDTLRAEDESIANNIRSGELHNNTLLTSESQRKLQGAQAAAANIRGKTNAYNLQQTQKQDVQNESDKENTALAADFYSRLEGTDQVKNQAAEIFRKENGFSRSVMNSGAQNAMGRNENQNAFNNAATAQQVKSDIKQATKDWEKVDKSVYKTPEEVETARAQFVSGYQNPDEVNAGVAKNIIANTSATKNRVDNAKGVISTQAYTKHTKAQNKALVQEETTSGYNRAVQQSMEDNGLNPTQKIKAFKEADAALHDKLQLSKEQIKQVEAQKKQHAFALKQVTDQEKLDLAQQQKQLAPLPKAYLEVNELPFIPFKGAADAAIKKFNIVTKSWGLPQQNGDSENVTDSYNQVAANVLKAMKAADRVRDKNGDIYSLTGGAYDNTTIENMDHNIVLEYMSNFQKNKQGKFFLKGDVGKVEIDLFKMKSQEELDKFSAEWAKVKQTEQSMKQRTKDSERNIFNIGQTADSQLSVLYQKLRADNGDRFSPTQLQANAKKIMRTD